MAKLPLSKIPGLFAPKEKYPPVVVEQTNFRISEIIRKNQAGEQVLGVKNLQFDYHLGDNYDFEKVNPFSDIGFNLDDVILLAERTGQQVTDLQNKQGELKAAMDKAKQLEEAASQAPAPAPAPAPADPPA